MVNESFLDIIYEAVKDQPASKPPPGINSNFIDPPNHRKLALGVFSTCIGITTIAVFSRMYAQICMVRKLHVEDWILPIAYLFELGHIIPAFHVSTFNPLLHQWDIPIRNISKFLLDVHIGALTYDTAIILLKLCILIQFLRIFVPHGKRSTRFWTTQVLIWTNTLFFLTCVFIRIFACKPMRKIWNPLIIEGHCLNIRLQQAIAAGFNTAFDLLILVWTQWIIWGLKMPWTRKFKFAALFIAGLGACLGAALRFSVNIKLLKHHNDEAYYAGWMAFWSYLETTSAFLIICLPVMPRLFKSLLKRVGLLTDDSKLTPLPAARDHSLAPNREPRRSWWHISRDSENSVGDTRALTSPGSIHRREEYETDEVVEIKIEDSGFSTREANGLNLFTLA